MSASLRDKILRAVRERGPTKTICPSEVLPPSKRQDPEQMRRVRAIAKKLIDEGLIVATSRNQIIDIENHRGPIRLRLK